VNPLDVKIRTGGVSHETMSLRDVIGIDIATIVKSVGANVSPFKSGDEVYGMTRSIGDLQGSLAEFASVDAHLLGLKPANLSMREAAALPLSVITAWEGLVDRAHVRAGQKLSIHAGAGGIRHVAAQIARVFGAEVFAAVSADKKTIAEGFGATPSRWTGFHQRCPLRFHSCANRERHQASSRPVITR
jgi:NADPH:quinone reductase-like Zn-dependent oxidoreductase